jgi:hypothetical protein
MALPVTSSKTSRTDKGTDPFWRSVPERTPSTYVRKRAGFR